MANALAYYDTATITAVKSFIVQASGVSPGKQSLADLLTFGKLDPFIMEQKKIFDSQN